MLTGDNERTAKAIASQVGIDDARGDLLPEDKLKIIEELTARNEHVGMVGDGINDAPALAKAGGPVFWFLGSGQVLLVSQDINLLPN